MTCKIDEKNVNYLISRCRRLENIVQKYMLEIEDKDERIKELEKEKETLFVGKSAAKLYQKELVKAEKRVKELEIALSNSNYSSEDSI